MDGASKRRRLHLGLLIALGALLYLPSFALDELDDEEGRRALPAREMVASGDFVLPTLFGRPYLAKPPLFFWSVAAASTVTGGVNEAATRLPSVLATLATALAVYALGRRAWDERTGLCSALLYLCTFSVFEKGAFGELEAAFSLTAFLASAGLWLSVVRGERGGSWVWLTGSFLGAALLTKGPPAFVFFAATALGLAMARGERSLLRSKRVWLPVLLGTALTSIWIAFVLARPEVRDAAKLWGDELQRGDGDGLGAYLASRWKFLVGVAAGFLPSSAIVLVEHFGAARGRARDVPRRAAELTVLLGLAFFGLMPGTHARYAFPLVPWTCLSAGRLLSARAEHGDAFGRRIGRGLRIVAVLGISAAGAVAWLAAGGRIGRIEGMGGAGAALALALVAVALFLWRTSRSVRPTALWAAFAVLALVREIQLFEVIPGAAGRRGRRASACELERGLPYDTVMHDASTNAYNVLFYVRAPIVAAEDPLALEPGAMLVVRSSDLARLEASGLVGREVARTRIYEGAQLVLLEIGCGDARDRGASARSGN